eukprot:GFUD01118554.1.p1 GENE.GFUD01118554.1~~GFUD01118554.1.p1  ORF type:complete len:212 (+),score=62.59 GFUD01118554.1:38-673(+)
MQQLAKVILPKIGTITVHYKGSGHCKFSTNILQFSFRLKTAVMKIFVALSCFVAAITALPQQDSFRELINSDLNSCGRGVRPGPNSCTCPDGTTFTPGPSTLDICGASSAAAICTCPDGRAVSSPTEQEIKDFFSFLELLNSDLNPCGAGSRPSTNSCTCPDGTIFTPGPSTLQICGASSTAATCTCANGRIVSSPTVQQIRDFVKASQKI